jgi:hypothetical protein
MTPQERQTRTEWLGKLGVPVQFHDAIISAPHNWLTAAGGAVLTIAMIAVTVGATVAAFIWLDAHVQARAVALATEVGASLVYVNVGLGPLILLFGLLALTGWVLSLLAGRHRVNGFLSSAAAMLNPPHPGQGLEQQLAPWIMQRFLSSPIRRATAGSGTVDDFLRRMAEHLARPWGIAAIVLLSLAIAVTTLETNSFWVAGPSGIVAYRMFPPFSSSRHDLSELTTLTTGCNHTDNDDILIYDVSLSSGEEFDLGNTLALAGSKPGAIEAIDTRIGNGIENRRWSHLDRDPVHLSCLSYWARQFDSDGQRRLAKLLRLTAQEARGTSAR